MSVHVLCDRQSYNINLTSGSIVQMHHFLQLVAMKTQFKEDEMKKFSYNLSPPKNASECPVNP